MKTTEKIITASLAAFALTAVSLSAFAYQGDPTVQGPNFTPERHEAIEAAMEAGDYNAWSELVSEDKGRILEVINEDNFDQFVKSHELALAGDIDGSKEIREELGLKGPRQGGRQGMHKGERRNFRDGSEGFSCMAKGTEVTVSE